jgi:hypothetical protein
MKVHCFRSVVTDPLVMNRAQQFSHPRLDPGGWPDAKELRVCLKEHGSVDELVEMTDRLPILHQ